MPKPTRAQLFERQLEDQSDRFKQYFFGIPSLVTGPGENLPAALAYAFHLIETAHHRILYGALCRMHDANSILAKQAVDSQHMTRKKFRELFANVIGVDFPDSLIQKADSAEQIRDRIVHGKAASGAEIWQAIRQLVDYAIELNQLVLANAGFEAFGDMRGVVGRRGGTPLPQGTTRWLLKGMGFNLG